MTQIFKQGTPERNGPLIADKARAYARQARASIAGPRYAVVSLHYATLADTRGAGRVWLHRTPKAALRRALSVCGGKLRERDVFAVGIVTPCNRVLSCKDMMEALA